MSLFSWCKTFWASHGNIIFIVMRTIWCAWKDVIFKNTRASAHESLAKIQSLVYFCSVAFSKQPPAPPNTTLQQLVSWSRPPDGYVCKNVDGSLLGSLQTAGFGGLIRNDVGSFLGGFYGVASQANILYVEIMAMLHGLELCWEKGFKHVVFFSDSLQMVTLIKYGVSSFHKFANEIISIRRLLDKDWIVVINHTLREGNACDRGGGAECNAEEVSLDYGPSPITWKVYSRRKKNNDLAM